MMKYIVLLMIYQYYNSKMNLDIQKSIEIFLEKNSLHKTLQIFKNESRRTNYGSSKGNKLQNIHKLVLNNSN